MKKVCLLVLASLVLVACGGSSSKGYAYNANEVITHEEFMTFVTEKDYEAAAGKSVDLSGIVFMAPKADEEFVYYTVLLDFEMMREAIVKVAKGSETLNDGDIIKVSGFFIDKDEADKIDDGLYTFRGSLVIEADTVEKTDYQTAFAPTLHSADLGLKQSQNNLEISIDKIEFAESETRLYVSIDNTSDDKVSISSYDFNVIANGKNHEETRGNYNANYPEIESGLYAKTKTEGIIVYDPIDFKTLDGLKIIVDSPYASDNWDIDFEDYVFDIPAAKLK